MLRFWFDCLFDDALFLSRVLPNNQLTSSRGLSVVATNSFPITPVDNRVHERGLANPRVSDQHHVQFHHSAFFLFFSSPAKLECKI